ncbi:MAG TPA: FAD-dependent oxidoreductase, partial [Acidimicrobiales bacterium]|nr:FAD-dependent oxidoreductase [Acidimicrobiales bacterium]
MANAVVIGAGPTGLTTAMLLAKAGIDVTVLDRDGPAPDDCDTAWEGWERRSVAQFRLVHFLQSGGRALLEQHVPEVVDKLLEVGAVRFNVVQQLAELLPGGPGDADYSLFETITTCRRPVMELAFVLAARQAKGIEIRNNCAAAELVTGPSVLSGVPHVTGVRTKDGAVLDADVVIDAAGRRTPVPGMIEQAGGRRPDEHVVDVGFVYNTRYYEAAEPPQVLDNLLSPVGSFSVLTIPGDRGFRSVTLYHAPADKAMRKVR